MSTASKLKSSKDRPLARTDTVRLPGWTATPKLPEPDGDEAAASAEEALVPDVRAQLRPAQQVEDKLRSLLKNAPLPVSQVRLTTLVQGRSHC